MNTVKPQCYVNKATHKVIVEKQFSPKRKKQVVDKILESKASCKAEPSVKPEATIFNAFAFPITTQLYQVINAFLKREEIVIGYNSKDKYHLFSTLISRHYYFRLFMDELVTLEP